MKKLWRRLLIVLAIAALAVGHVVYHYSPRLRAARPSEGGEVARLLGSSEYPVALWVPYPHQNLTILDRAVGGGETYAAAVARLAELEPVRLPAFGPFRLPPSRELAVVTSESGERWAVFAQVYPSLAIFSRLAGRLAGNPWLAGGSVEVAGRPVEVAWRGNVWTVSAGAPPSLEAEPAPAGEPGLGLLVLRQGSGSVPPGEYRLLREGASFEVRAEVEPPVPAFEPAQLEERGGVLLAVTGRGDAPAPAARALVYFGQPEGAWELPRTASLHQEGRKRHKLPAEELLKVAGKKPHRTREGSWRIAALDRQSLESAVELAPELEALVGSGRLVRGVWLDPRAASAEVAKIAAVMEQIPLVPRSELERARDAEAVLAPLAERFSWLSLVVTEEPDALRLRLEAAPR